MCRLTDRKDLNENIYYQKRDYYSYYFAIISMWSFPLNEEKIDSYISQFCVKNYLIIKKVVSNGATDQLAPIRRYSLFKGQ